MDDDALLTRFGWKPTDASVRSVLVPGVFSAMAGRLAERAGFGCLYLSGSATAASQYGLPDLGVIGRREMLEAARNLVHAVRVPVIVDGDTGYGNAASIRETVRGVIGAGAAAITVEDQVLEKRCGYAGSPRVVDRDTLARRIDASQRARGSADLVVVGRTDALASEGLESAIERCSVMAAAGADVVWILGLQALSAPELREVRRSLPVPAMVDDTELAGSRPHSFEELAGAGFEIVLVPMSAMLASMRAMEEVFRALKDGGDWRPYEARLVGFEEYNDIAGMGEAAAFERDRR